MSNLLRIENLSHKFQDQSYAFKDISMTINTGEFIILTGKNGSGKTVFLQHLNALLKPSSGKILLNGKDIHSDIRTARQKIGYIFQNPDSQIIGTTVLNDVMFGPINLGMSLKDAEQSAIRALKQTELTHLLKRFPHDLSGGEKRRLAVAGVIAMNPDVIIFDEPFENLDYGGVVSLLKNMIQLHNNKKTIIVVNHDIDKISAQE